jgi:uncharacterized protein DUF6879
MSELLDEAALGALLGGFDQRLFRMETLARYSVDSDGDDYRRWLAGEPEPSWDRLGRWLNVLREERAAGKISRRVRLFSERLSDYERYACEFGYQHTARAGEEIRVLRRGEHTVPTSMIERDFWIVDDERVIAMHYDHLGAFDGAEVCDDTQLRAHLRARDEAWNAGEPFSDWWTRHPELHRRLAV